MAKCGQMLPDHGSRARMFFFTPLTVCKIKQVRICDGNLCGLQSLKYLLPGSLQIKFAGGTGTAKHWQANRRHTDFTC